MSKQFVCPKCGGAAYRVDLDTRPMLLACDDCNDLFTRCGRVPMATARICRKAILQRWDQLADDVHHLVQDIRNASPGTFTDRERDSALFELDNTVWDVMVNYRPRLPASPYKARRDRIGMVRRAILRQSYLDSLTEAKRKEWVAGVCPEKLDRWLKGEDFGCKSPVAAPIKATQKGSAS